MKHTASAAKGMLIPAASRSPYRTWMRHTASAPAHSTATLMQYNFLL